MKLDIQHIAKLANLHIDKEEEKRFEEQLSETLDYVEKLNEIDTENVEPTSQVTGLQNIAREDIAMESLTQEQALSNTKSQHNGFFQVKAILENQ